MRKALLTVLFVLVIFLTIRSNLNIKKETEKPEQNALIEISGTIKKGETLFDIFKKHNLDMGVLFKLKEASANVYKLGKVHPDHRYKMVLDNKERINSFDYWIDDDNILNITNTGSGFTARKNPVEYEVKILYLGGTIKENLISAMGEDGAENILLALRLSDIFAWDIDFTTDIRESDTYKLVVEGRYLNGDFKKYGEILSAEFINNGSAYKAYRFEYDGKADYYDDEGNSLRSQFLKSPLSFRRISSHFTKKRFHPILKIYRPHHGIDYSAPSGTPVSAVGSGTISFVGYKGGYGKLIILRHPNGWKTCYGHLSRFGKNLKRGSKVQQGQVIGYVGSTGQSTGPHLHYEMRINNKAVNPFSIKVPKRGGIPKKLMAEFRGFKSRMDERLASIMPTAVVIAKNKGE